MIVTNVKIIMKQLKVSNKEKEKMDFLCLDIVNSNLTDWRSSPIKKDMLDDQQWLSQLFAKWELGSLLPLDSATKERLISLRKEIHESIVELNAGHSGQVQLKEINQVLKSVSLHPHLVYEESEYHIENKYNKTGWSFVIWRIAYSFAGLLANQDNNRIKICSNEDCDWVFFDHSKNKSRRWCDDKVCGNIMKARRFRDKKKNN